VCADEPHVRAFLRGIVNAFSFFATKNAQVGLSSVAQRMMCRGSLLE
jgi:hypothetical protein